MIDTKLLMNNSLCKNVPKGTVLAKSGTYGGEMFILLKGEVGAYRNYGGPGEVNIAIMMPGDFFGETALFLDKARSATFVALEDVIILELNRSNSLDFFSTQPEAAFAMIKTMCSRLDAALKAYYESRNANTTAAEKPADASEETQSPKEPNSRKNDLFPEGHKQYVFNFTGENEKFLITKSFICPCCGVEFKSSTVRKTMLRPEKTDYDLRVHYRNIEPIYYDVLTCPSCWYSAFQDNFEDVYEARTRKTRAELILYIAQLSLDFKSKRSADTIFAGYYLSLKCAELCARHPELPVAKAWMRLSWLYRDCEDADMEEYAIKQALNAYQEVYSKVDLSESHIQQVCYILGELSYKTGDINGARKLYHSAKINKNGSTLIKGFADDRLNETKKLV